jgi:hypothetical protein
MTSMSKEMGYGTNHINLPKRKLNCKSGFKKIKEATSDHNKTTYERQL